MADPNITNLDELTSKIYQDGIEKAEEASQKMLNDARQKRDEIIQQAEDEAERIVSAADREATRVKNSIENELRLKGKQLISDLKREIRALVSQGMVKKGLSESFMDQDFLQQAILEAISHWKDSRTFTLTLPEKLKAKLDKSFEQRIGAGLDGLTIHFNGKLKGGFHIKRDADDFEITFSEEDFNTLLQSYLSESANAIFSKG